MFFSKNTTDVSGEEDAIYDDDFDLEVLPTPNPNALKFVSSQKVKTTGKSTYFDASQCRNNPLAESIIKIPGVDTVHFFENTITVTKFSYEDWKNLESEVTAMIEDGLVDHNPDYPEYDPETERRKNLSPELKKIEEILDETIRQALQGDGGDLECLDFTDNVLIIKYQGACGTCPSSSTGTLQAIRAVLKEKYHPDIEVYISEEGPKAKAPDPFRFF